MPAPLQSSKKSIRSLIALAASAGLFSVAVAWQNVPKINNDPFKPLPASNQAAPRFWKGNLHTHSLWSDGDDFPEMIADWYKRHDYHFLALTDHNVLSEGERWVDAAPENLTRSEAIKKYVARFGEQWVERRTLKDKPQIRLKPLREFRSMLDESDRFTLIPGEEISHRFGTLPVHMNGINLRDPIIPISADGVAEMIRVNLGAVADQRKRTGWRNISFVNHPNFGWGVRAEDMVILDELRYFEIFNGHPSVRNYGDATHVSTEQMWDIVLALRLGKHKLPLVYGMATDDAHGYHVYGVGKVNPGRGWVMVRAPYLSAEAIVRGLESGDFYCSSGVKLEDFGRKGNELRIAIKGEEGVRFKTQFIATLRSASLDSEPRLDKDGKPLTVTRVYSNDVGKVIAESDDLNPTYVMTGQELYVRAKIISTKLHANPFQKGDVEVAWTQPVAP
jgi:hypothetical protein